MKMKRAYVLSTWLTLPLAATVALAACAPQAVQQANRAADVPAAVEQVQASALLPAGTFTGMVATEQGGKFVPVANATVQVDGAATLAVTDSEGHYVINGLKPGSYQVSVTKDGFVKGQTEVNLSPVAGTPRVNVAIAKAEYGLKAITPITSTITGVVKDPRGAALPSATVKVASSTGTGLTSTQVTADVNGFYNTQLTNAAVSPLSPGWVQVTAFGTTPGGVKVEVSTVVAKELTGASLVCDAKCDAFTLPKNITFPQGTFTPMGSTGTVKAEYFSKRADEFYLELTSGAQKYAVLPEAITNTDAGANNTPPQNCVVTFRVPFTMPSSTFSLKIVPFGIATAAQAGPSNFVVNYDATAFEADVAYNSEALTDISEPAILPPNINQGLYVAGEDAKYTINLVNNSPDVSQDIKLKGKAPVNTTIASVKVTPKSNAVVGTAITIAAGNIVQPNGTGDWSVTGFSIPAKVAANKGEALVEVVFTSPVNQATGSQLALTAMACEMPSAAIVKTTAPNSTLNLGVSNIDQANIKFSAAKVIADEGAMPNGIGQVTLVITPTGATALGAIKITDQTLTSITAPTTPKATIIGTHNPVLPASPTALGLLTSDKIGVQVDANPEVVVSVISTSWDLETLCGFVTSVVNAASGSTVIDCKRSGNQFFLQRTAQGTSKKVAITNSSTNNLLTQLGLVVGQQSGQDGVDCLFSGAGVSATQPGGTVWTFNNATSAHNADKSVTATFTLQPPTAFVGADTFTTPITVVYRIQNTGGATINLGGGGAAMGAKMTAVNLIAPYTTAGKDLALATNANTKIDDITEYAARLLLLRCFAFCLQ